MKDKIIVLGCFGYHNNQLDGQTIKSRKIFELLKEHNCNVVYSDTQEWRQNRNKIIKYIADLYLCKTLILIPGARNVKILFPIIFILCKLFRCRLILIAVGGWLDSKYRKWRIHRYMGRHIDATLVQNYLLVQTLENEFGIKNVEKIPNFRDLTTYRKRYRKNSGDVLRLVFMARIHRDKGLDYIAYLAEHIKSHYVQGQITIDFYGQINPPDEEYFMQELVNKYAFVNFHGALPPELIVDELHKYDVMLLPTKYYTEGFPGSILDAYRSSIPVIVTRWKFAEEFVQDGSSGFIVPFDNPVKSLCERVDFLYDNPYELEKLKEGAYRECLNYTPDKAWNVLRKYL